MHEVEKGAGNRLGGYRLIRRLAVDANAEVHLAVPITGGDPVAIKVPSAAVSTAAMFAMADALWRARGRHVVQLLDAIDRGADAPALVLDRVETGLTAVLADGQLEPGAAATVLLPIAAAVRTMHLAGVAHGAIGPPTIRLDASGAPVLIGFGRARRFAPAASPAARASIREVIEDAIAVRSLAISLLSASVDAPGVDGITGPDDLREIARDPDGWLEHLERRIGERIQPGPLPSAVIAPGSSVGDAIAALRPRRPAPTEPGARARRRGRRTVRVPSLKVGALAGPLDRLGARALRVVGDRMPDAAFPVLRRLRSQVGQVRARVWVPATVVLLAIIGAGVLMPSGDGDAAPAATPAAERTTATVDAGAEPRAIASPDGDGDVDGDGDGADTAPSGMSSDPEVAVLELVSNRAACLLDRDVECLADVLQAGSPAESSDRVAIAAVSTPIPAAEWHPVEAVLVDLLGGAALVDVIVSTPDGVGSVPVLIVRSGERWLIRTVLADPAPTAQP